MRVVVLGAAAGAPAGAEVQKELEVDLWSVLCLGHDLDLNQHHQSNLLGQDHDHDLDLDLLIRSCQVVVEFLTKLVVLW